MLSGDIYCTFLHLIFFTGAHHQLISMLANLKIFFQNFMTNKIALYYGSPVFRFTQRVVLWKEALAFIFQ